MLTVGSALTVLSTAARADDLPGEHPMLNKRFNIAGGGFFPFINSTIRLDSDLDLGTEISFEDTLGLEQTMSTFWLGGQWNIAKRHSLDVEFVQLNRNASVSGITEELEIGDTVLQAGGRIDTTFDIDLYRVTYGYSPLRNEKSQLMVQGGLHVADLGASLRLAGALVIDGEVLEDAVATEGASLTAPLPHFGIKYERAFSEKIALATRLIGFALAVDDVEGSIIQGSVMLQYAFNESLGVGAGAQLFDVKVEDTAGIVRADFNFGYYGPIVHLFGAF
jgi:hypothetical protein